MTETLVAFAGLGPEEPLVWRTVIDGVRIRARGEGVLSDLSSVAHDELVIVIPGTQTASFMVSIAARGDKQLRAVAPFAIEDDIACDVEDVHVALGPAEEGTERRSLHVIQRELMEEWRDALAQHKLKLKALAPDYLVLPARGSTLVRLDMKDRTLIGNSYWGATVERTMGNDALAAIVEAARQLFPNGGETGAPSPVPHDDAPLDILALTASSRRGELLQGPFAVRQEGTGDLGLQRFRAPAMLVAASFLAFVVLQVSEGIVLDNHAKAARQRTEALFREHFPEVKRIVNPRAQALALTSDQGDSASDFLQLSSLIASALSDVPGLDIESVRYDGAKAELQASVRFSSYGDLSSFKQHIEANGAVLTEGGSRQSGDKRVGDVTVSW